MPTTFRRVTLVVTLVLLVLAAALAGTIAADWPYLARVLATTRLASSAERALSEWPVAEWPESLPAPVAVLDGAGDRAWPWTGNDATDAPAGIEPAALAAATRWAEANDTRALLVMHRGRLVLERYWGGQSAHTPFAGEAMSRVLVALAYGAAVDRGLLALDDPAARHLDEWRDDPRGAITLRQLLQDVSGLAETDGPPVVPGPDAGLGTRLAALPRLWADRNLRLALGNDFAANALAFPLRHQPGTHFAFSAVNPQLLGVILERASGEPLVRWLQREVWAPLGAERAELRLDRVSGMPATFCCLRATPRDWLRIGALLADDGAFGGRQVLPRGWVAQLAAGSNVNPRRGLQVWSGRATRGLREYQPGSGRGVRHGADFRADDVIWIEGAGGRGVWAVPSQRLVVVRLGTDAPGWDGSELLNTLLAGLQGAATAAR